MQTAIVLRMSDTRNNEDRAYDPIRDIKRQLDSLSGHISSMRSDVTEIRTAITGNELGTEGLASRQERIENDLLLLISRVERLERNDKLKRRYLLAFFATLGTVAGTVIKTIIDHLVPIKK